MTAHTTHAERDPLEYQLDAEFFGRLAQPRFRGQIWDYARTFELGSSYEVPKDNVCRDCRAQGIKRCRHFEIDTARQLVGPMQAIRDDNVRMVMVLKATQTLGSLVWDLALHWFIVHSPYQTMIVFLDADDKAQNYCDKRLMPTLKANPDIEPFIPTGIDRHDATKTDIKFTNGKIIRICGLNESNASSLTWQVVVIDEGWLHYSDGLMQKGIDRAKQVENRKVIIIGQAGKADEDQDKLWKGLNKRVPLTFACPCCDGRQEFSFTKARPEDFQPIIREGVEPPKPGTYYGLTVPQRFSEITDVKAAAKEAYYECYHCGHHIADTKENRAAMMATYQQDWQMNGLTPPNYEVGFWNPDPASVTLPFAQTMAAYIAASKADKERGNRQPLMDFYQNRWATAWSDGIIGIGAAALPMHIFDADKPLPGELVRIAGVDVQDNLTNVWIQIWAIGEGAAMRLLWWEHVESPMGMTLLERRAHVKNRCRELFKKFKVQPQNVKFDRAHVPEIIFEWAAEDCVRGGWLRDRAGNKTKQDVFYGLVLGDPSKGYKHKTRGNKYVWAGFSPVFYEQVVLTNKLGQREVLRVPYRLMSTDRSQKLAQRFIDQQDSPKMEIPPAYLADKSLLGFWSQLNSETQVLEKGKMVWRQISQRPNHGRDGFRMVLMRMEEVGLLTFVKQEVEEADAAD